MELYHKDIVDINLESGTVSRSFLIRSIGEQDNNANAFGVRLFRNNEPVNIGAGWVQGFFKNSRGENIALTEHGVIEGNEAYVILPQACYNYEGQFTLAIKIVSQGSENTVTMRIIDGIVDNTNTGGAVAPTGTVPTYQEILSVYEQMRATLNAAVRYDITQELTNAQKTKARDNIGAASQDGLNQAVKYTAQSLTDAQKTQARSNIGAASQDGLNQAVKYTAQSLTDSQKTQARSNINGQSDVGLYIDSDGYICQYVSTST